MSLFAFSSWSNWIETCCNLHCITGHTWRDAHPALQNHSARADVYSALLTSPSSCHRNLWVHDTLPSPVLEPHLTKQQIIFIPNVEFLLYPPKFSILWGTRLNLDLLDHEHLSTSDSKLGATASSWSTGWRRYRQPNFGLSGPSPAPSRPPLNGKSWVVIPPLSTIGLDPPAKPLNRLNQPTGASFKS